MKKKELEIILQRSIEELHHKEPTLEQYSTPAHIAADMLFESARDIIDRRVADLGCGNGILGIGAKLLGAKEVHCVDVDPAAIETARKNAEKLGLSIEFHASDVETFELKADTVIQNPPFGCQRKHADLKFIRRAVEIAPVVYSLHRAETLHFIRKFCESRLGCSVEKIKIYKFPIKHTFYFHKKDVEFFDVVLVKIRRVENESCHSR